MKRKLFFKLFLAVVPLLVMALFYLYADPFMILRDYGDLYNTDKPHLELNEDYVATEAFLRLSPKENFDSYIFGSSRSRYYTPSEMTKKIPAAKAYQFGVASETLFGVARKIRFLDKQGIALKHVLIVADPELLSKAENSKGHLFRKHPLVSGESNTDFQFTCFMDFFNFEAISSYLKLPKTVVKGKKDPQQEAEQIIEKDRDSYYRPRMNIFYKRPATQQYAKQVIDAQQIELLTEMKQIFDKDGTDYRIVLSPMYDQEKLNSKDMDILCSIFDRNRIYDFSGINDITADMYNYFETAHYRPAIAARIMDSVYLAHP